jgi:rubrerythrin
MLAAIRNKKTGVFVQVSDINGGRKCPGIAAAYLVSAEEIGDRIKNGTCADFDDEYDILGECAQSIEDPDDFELVEIEMEIKVVRTLDDTEENLKSFMYPEDSYDKYGDPIVPDIVKARQRRRDAAERGEVLRAGHIIICSQCDRAFDDGHSVKHKHDVDHCPVCRRPLCPECSGDNHKCEGLDPYTATLEAAMNCPVDEEAIAILMKGFDDIGREEAVDVLAQLRR